MIDIKKQYKHLLLLVMVILFLTGCFSESINKRISRSLGIEIPKDIKIEYEDTHGGFHGDGETVAVVEFNNSIGEDIQSEMLNNEDWNKLPLRGSSVFSEKSHQIYVFINKIGTHRKLFNESLGVPPTFRKFCTLSYIFI